jgi:cobalt-zinc-cadmium efflux system protein
LIGVLIMVSSIRVLRSSLHILVEGTPEGISLPRVSQSILEVPGVASLHDLHVWNICSGRVALSAHVVLCEKEKADSEEAMVNLKTRLSNRFGIEHTTVQFEAVNCSSDASACRCR